MKAGTKKAKKVQQAQESANEQAAAIGEAYVCERISSTYWSI
jgi:hypothetical protein